MKAQLGRRYLPAGLPPKALCMCGTSLILTCAEDMGRAYRVGIEHPVLGCTGEQGWGSLSRALCPQGTKLVGSLPSSTGKSLQCPFLVF